MLESTHDFFSENEKKNLREIIAQCEFIELTTSHQEYLNHPGSGLPLLRINTPQCKAVIAFQGAQLLEYSATNKPDLLWLSPRCNFSPKVALRGGVPVCLPWFGKHETDAKKPKHGFARTENWQLTTASQLATGEVELIFLFSSNACELFAFNFSAKLIMTLGKSAKLTLSVSNTDTNSFDCSWALHSYFAVESLATALATGLAGKYYADCLDNSSVKLQENEINFPYEVDRSYYNVENSVGVKGAFNIDIHHHNCPSVVVWNPGAENAENIGDIGAGNEQHFICVERGAVCEDQWNLAAGETKSAWIDLIYA